MHGTCSGASPLYNKRVELSCKLTFRTRGLFSKHLTVVALPLNLMCPPKSLHQRVLCNPVSCLVSPHSSGCSSLGLMIKGANN